MFLEETKEDQREVTMCRGRPPAPPPPPPPRPIPPPPEPTAGRVVTGGDRDQLQLGLDQDQVVLLSQDSNVQLV